MSKTQEHNYGRCTDCGNQLREERDDYKRLHLTCECGDSRPIKIAELPPEKWDL